MLHEANEEVIQIVVDEGIESLKNLDSQGIWTL